MSHVLDGDGPCETRCGDPEGWKRDNGQILCRDCDHDRLMDSAEQTWLNLGIPPSCWLTVALAAMCSKPHAVHCECHQCVCAVDPCITCAWIYWTGTAAAIAGVS